MISLGEYLCISLFHSDSPLVTSFIYRYNILTSGQCAHIWVACGGRARLYHAGRTPTITGIAPPDVLLNT